MKRFFQLFGVLCLLFTFNSAFSHQRFLPVEGVEVLEGTHAHNDYEHPNPLFDALDNGFTSIEPDVFILRYDDKGQLYDDKMAYFNEHRGIESDDPMEGYHVLVAHDFHSKESEYKGTLEELYLQPLLDNNLGEGKYIYEGYNEPIVYMIDLKSNHPGSVEFMNEYLKKYDKVINKSSESGKPINVILSGYNAGDISDDDIDFLNQEQENDSRYVGIDGRVDEKLPSQDERPEFYPLISNHFRDRDLKQLHANIIEAHNNGHKIRFWGIEDTRKTWEMLYDAGVDVISTDDLEGLRDFMLERQN